MLDGSADGAWDPATVFAAAGRHSPTAIAARYDEVLRSLRYGVDHHVAGMAR